MQKFFFAFLNSLDPRNQGGTLLSWLRPSRGSWGPISNLAGNSIFLDFVTKPNNMGAYGLPWATAPKIWHFWVDLNPPEGPGVPFQIWREIQSFSISSQNPTIKVSMDSQGSQQPRFDIFGWLKPSRGSLSLISNLAGNSNFFTKMNNVGVYGPQLPRFDNFELTQALQRVPF